MTMCAFLNMASGAAAEPIDDAPEQDQRLTV